ncbi:MAG: glycosyltransferase [Bryobacteraceae bacterium]
MPDSVNQDAPPSLRASVILLTYNQAPALRRALAALEQSQGRESFEIVVVDCASQDGSGALDVEFPAIHMLRLPHHMGAARALNIAVRTAKADLVLFLSPNVEVQANTVIALADVLDADLDTVAVCPSLPGATHTFRMPDPANVRLVSVQPDSDTVEFPSLDALMVRKAFIVAMNFFDQRYGHYWVDAELAMQIRRVGKKIRYRPDIQATYHAAPDPLAEDSLAETDRVVGAAEYAGKYGGGSFGMRMGAAFAQLGRFNFGGFFGLLSGQKIDGSQAH